MEVLSKYYGKEFKIAEGSLDYADMCKQPCRMEYANKMMVERALETNRMPNYIILDVGHNRPALVQPTLIQIGNHTMHNQEATFISKTKSDSRILAQ